MFSDLELRFGGQQNLLIQIGASLLLLQSKDFYCIYYSSPLSDENNKLSFYISTSLLLLSVRSSVALQRPGRAACQRMVGGPLRTRRCSALPPARVRHPGHGGAANPLRLEAVVGGAAARGLHVAPSVGLHWGERHTVPQPSLRYLFYQALVWSSPADLSGL